MSIDRHQRRLGVFAVLPAALLASVACTAPTTSSSEGIGETSEAIWGGRTEADTDDLNAVVDVGGFCTGTLITPRLVVSAAHCFASVGTKAFTVRIGPDPTAPKVQVNMLKWETHPKYTGADDARHDVALVWLANPVSTPLAVNAVSKRPNFTTPAFDTSVTPQVMHSTSIHGYSPFNRDKTANATYSKNRTGFDWAKMPLTRTADANGAYWTYQNDTTEGIQHGDSGGPLEVGNVVVGVLSTFMPVDNDTSPTGGQWTDITHPIARDWILSRVHDDQVNGGHTAAWRAQHGKTDPNNFWFGDQDYEGACTPATDRDCDRWLDVHDNCPTTANTDQLDSRGIGVGDACYTPSHYYAEDMSTEVTCTQRVDIVFTAAELQYATYTLERLDGLRWSVVDTNARTSLPRTVSPKLSDFNPPAENTPVNVPTPLVQYRVCAADESTSPEGNCGAIVSVEEPRPITKGCIIGGTSGGGSSPIIDRGGVLKCTYPTWRDCATISINPNQNELGH